MKDWYSGIYKSFIMASVVAFFISMLSTGNVSYGSELAGYSALIFGVMMILIILFKGIFHELHPNLFYLLFITFSPSCSNHASSRS